ncbi:MAG: transporter ATP-binding protein [Chitinophagaceae bacterium]|nr:transporter ATP-binding protein [Chitinophagaceae bacterium]
MKLKFNHILCVLNKKEKKQFRFIVFFDIVNTLTDLLFLAGLVMLIEVYTVHTAQYNFLSRFINHNNFVFVSGLYLLFFCFKNYISYQLYKKQYQFFYNVASRISGERLLNYLEGDYSNYVNTDSSVHIKKISQQPVEFAHYVLSGLQQIISQAVLIFLTVIVLIIWKPFLFLLVAGLLVPAIFIISRLLKKQLQYARTMSKKASEESLQTLQQALSGFIETNLYNKNQYFTRRYLDKQTKLNDHLAAIQTTQGMPSKMMEVFAVAGFFIIVVVNMWVGEPVQLFTIGAFMAAAYKIIPGIVKIVNARAHLKTYAYTLDITEPRLQKDIAAMFHTINSVAFNDVSFSYDGKQLLDKLSFRIEKGDFALVSGLSGRGKSSMLNVLLGFVQSSNGKIMVNNKEVQGTGLRNYWERIAYNKQQPFIFYASLQENICLGDDEKQERMDDVLTATGIKSFGGILTREKNNLFNLSENGRNISGGQRQRVALARTLYRDADLYIFDESFSELDESAEINLIRHCAALAEKGKMVLLVSHNNIAKQYCNKIIEL